MCGSQNFLGSFTGAEVLPMYWLNPSWSNCICLFTIPWVILSQRTWCVAEVGGCDWCVQPSRKYVIFAALAEITLAKGTGQMQTRCSPSAAASAGRAEHRGCYQGNGLLNLLCHGSSRGSLRPTVIFRHWGTGEIQLPQGLGWRMLWGWWGLSWCSAVSWLLMEGMLRLRPTGGCALVVPGL